MPALTTYPGTVTPLRGLAPFVESERDVLFGRDGDRDAVAKLITQEGVRAGLLFGEPGVGKSSLLRAGLIPHLRDHGVVALPCDDLASPTDGFAQAVAQATSLPAKAGEKSLDYLARVVAQALKGQLFVFVVDDVDVALRADPDGRLAHELGDLFMRIATRSGGRARFLFAAADLRLHALDALERRTGSLFPPAARFRLGRFTAAQAHEVLERTLALAGVGADPMLARSAAETLAQEGLILPADLQIVARALRDLQIGNAAALMRAGGAGELCRRWVLAAAAAAGDERRGMRLLVELAIDDAGPIAPEMASARAGVEPEFARQAFAALVARGVCVAVPMPDGASTWYALAHEILVPRVRELAAPAREGARRARRILASAAQRRGRLTWREYREVQAEAILPTTADEARALTAPRRLARMALGAAVALPLVILIAIYVSLAGSYHLSVEGRGASARLVTRAGKPGLSAFWWLPHDPPFGSIVADSGFTAAMVVPGEWSKAARGVVGGSLGDVTDNRKAFVAQSLGALKPQLRGLVLYALSPEDERPLADLRKAVNGPDELAHLLWLLKPLARGGPTETQLVAEALADPSPVVQRAALELAAEVARRRPGSYRDVLARAMASQDAEPRRLAFAAARSLGPEAEAELVAAALGARPGEGARRDLLGALAAQGHARPATLAAAAVAILSSGADPALREKAWAMLDRAFERDAAEAARAAARLAGDTSAPEDVRVKALKLVEERAPKDATGLAPDIEAAVASDVVSIRSAALPLFARIAPDEAARKLVAIVDPPPVVRAAQAAAWGELARVRPDAAAAALETLLDDSSATVRAAAARAYGRIGRSAQDRLGKLVKNEGGEVAEGAAWGLAASVEAGGSAGTAVNAVYELWKRKGSARRLAAQVYARIARSRPQAVLGYLEQAAREKDDPALRPIGVDGLCAALGAGSAKAVAAPLQAAARDDARDTRVRVAVCLAARPDETGDALLKVALKLAEDDDVEIRLEAARALAGTVKKGKAPRGVGPTLARLVADGDRRVRGAAAEGLAALGGEPPREVGPGLKTAWGRADEAEKLVLLEVGRAMAEADLVRLAARDPSPTVRTRALGAAVLLRVDVPVLLGGALTDPDPAVRREALRLIGDPQTALATTDAVKALELAVRDADPSVAEAALTALAQVDEPARAAERLAAGLAHPSEAVRAQAARAAAGLAARDPKLAATVLEPALADPAHDVRVAVVPSLAAAYAASKTPAELAKLLEKSERDAVLRLVAVDALLFAARAGKAADVKAALEPLAKEGPAFAQLAAQLTLGLVAADADGVAFVALLVP